MPTRGDRHLRAMQLAKQLAALGARLKTIHLITGIPPRQVQSLFFPDAHTIPRGRAPTRPSGTTAPTSSCGPTPASLAPDTASCATRTRHRRSLGSPYRAYQAATLPPYRISLDRAFNLVSYIDGIWLTNAPALSVLTCPGAAASSLPRSAPWHTPVRLAPSASCWSAFTWTIASKRLTRLAPPST
jgi:hypothetical protein